MREAEGDLRHTAGEKANDPSRGRDGGDDRQPRNAGSRQTLEEAGDRLSSRARRGGMALPTS